MESWGTGSLPLVAARGLSIPLAPSTGGEAGLRIRVTGVKQASLTLQHTDGETEALSREVASSSSPSKTVAELGSEPAVLNPRSSALSTRQHCRLLLLLAE
ncbi:unnamed protein product [Caretta caretta]